MKVEKAKVEKVTIEEGVSISLNREEAAALFVILGSISGNTFLDRNNVRKVVSDDLWELLNNQLDFFDNEKCIHKNEAVKFRQTIRTGLVVH